MLALNHIKKRLKSAQFEGKLMRNPLKLLIVDDDNLIHDAIKLSVSSTWQLTHVFSEDKIPNDNFDAAVVDMHLSTDQSVCEGVSVIKKLANNHPQLEIIAMSGDLNSDILESCLKAGAFRFLPKPLSHAELTLTLEKIEALILLKRACFRPHGTNFKWLGNSEATTQIRRQVAQLKSEPNAVLIEGESGTGKEVIATLLHQQEPERPWIQLNVAAIAENLFESEFFGHVKGAFTGADQNKLGLAEAADNGDLFLDEIEALPLEQQAKLLRFLESGEIRRVGSKTSTKVNVRIIAATNRNLNEMVKKGEFREDLLWRLQGHKITLPPLRNRSDDIPLLAESFINAQKPRYTKKFTEAALIKMRAYHWPGNVRELKRVCEQLCITSPLPFIREEDVVRLLPIEDNNDSTHNANDLSLGLVKLVERFESSILQTSLERVKDVEEAAKLLKISRSTLYKKLKDLEISH